MGQVSGGGFQLRLQVSGICPGRIFVRFPAFFLLCQTQSKQASSGGIFTMSLKNFRSFHLSVEFHKECERAKIPGYLRNQVLRASSSICLNLGEGDSKPTVRDRMKYFHIALGSCRECQAAFALLPQVDPSLDELLDR